MENDEAAARGEWEQLLGPGVVQSHLGIQGSRPGSLGAGHQAQPCETTGGSVGKQGAHGGDGGATTELQASSVSLNPRRVLNWLKASL